MSEPNASLERTASQLRDTLKALAASLRPFPSFLGMATLQAVEVEPQGPGAQAYAGCIVVCPDGELYTLTLTLIPGPTGLSDTDHVERLESLDLPPQEYIPYAREAIETLERRLKQPGP
jgi:hypothetical protein